MQAKTDQQKIARDLYLQADKSQSEIAEIINVNRKTIFLWMKKGKWEELKIAAQQGPSAILQDIHNHIYHVNKKIREREDNCPTSQEVEMLRKLIGMTKNFTKKNIGFYIEAFEEITLFIAKKDYKLCKELTKHLDSYVQSTFGDENFYVSKRVQENIAEVERNLARNDDTPKPKPVSEASQALINKYKLHRLSFPAPLACQKPEIIYKVFNLWSTKLAARTAADPIQTSSTGNSGIPENPIPEGWDNDGAMPSNAGNTTRPATGNIYNEINDRVRCPISPTENSGAIKNAAYCATLPPSERPFPFREGDTIRVNNINDIDDNYADAKMADSIRHYPDT